MIRKNVNERLLLYTLRVTLGLLIVGLGYRAESQTTNMDHDVVVALIKKYEGLRTYATSNAGPMLGDILQGIVDNQFDVYTNQFMDGKILRRTVIFSTYNDGLKYRLLANTDEAKMLRQAAAADDPREGKLLKLLYYTKQGVVPAFITDAQLTSLFGGNGGSILSNELLFWKNKKISDDLLAVLEEYPPNISAELIYLIAETWYTQTGAPLRAYENASVSWASDSLWQIYFSVREVLLARRSVVAKLLVDNGYIVLPTHAQAVFTWSGAKTRYLKLDPPVWSKNDLPTLRHLSTNTIYGAMATAQLQKMGAVD